MPLMSVVIAACDRPQTLPDTLRSVLAQTVALEILVIDDSRTQSAEAVVRGIDDPRLRYVSNPTPTGGKPAVVRNIGLHLAQGEIIHFLDDDDLVAPGYYQAALAAFAAAPNIGLVFGVITPFGDDAETVASERRYFAKVRSIARFCKMFGSRWGFAASQLFASTLLVCSAGLVRREHAMAVGGFNETMPLIEDVDFAMRVMRHGGARFLDRPAISYRIGPSLMRQANPRPLILQSSRIMHRRYIDEHGRLEYLALKILGKGALRW